MPKPAIIVPFYKRPGVFTVWCEIMRAAVGDQATIIAVGSEGKTSKQLAESYGLHYVEYKNRPLGAKFNAGFHEARRLGASMVGIFGSDNIICSQYLPFVLSQNRDIIGHSDSYRLDILGQRAMYWTGYAGKRQGEPVGSGRFISARLLDKIGWKPYPDDKNMSLDWHFWKKVRSRRHSFRLFSLAGQGLYHAGMKSDMDKNSYDSIGGTDLPFVQTIKNFPNWQQILEYGRATA